MNYEICNAEYLDGSYGASLALLSVQERFLAPKMLWRRRQSSRMLVVTKPSCVRLTNVDLAHRMNKIGVWRVVVPEGCRVDDTASHTGILPLLATGYVFKEKIIRQKG